MNKEPQKHAFDPFTGEHMPACIAIDRVLNLIEDNLRLSSHIPFTYQDALDTKTPL